MALTEDMELEQNDMYERQPWQERQDSGNDFKYDYEWDRGYREWINPSMILRTMARAFRIIVPLFLIGCVTVILVNHWSDFMGIISICLPGMVIGGALTIWLSRRSFYFFRLRTIIVGALLGGVVTGLIAFNVLGINDSMADIANGIMPLIIACAGIWLMIRGIFR